MKKYLLICLSCFVFTQNNLAQGWTLKLKSSAEKEGKALSGANIKLYQGSKIISQSVSGGGGDFTIEIPPNGDFMLVVSYPDCNTKKFQISTLGVPEEISNDRFRPSFEIGGVTMAKPLYSIDYSVLQQPLVKIAYMADSKKFDHDEAHTEQMLMALGKIREAEKALIAKQKEACDAGDAALKKNDCELAKQNYGKAVSLIPQLPYETYPKQGLIQAEQCFKAKDAEANKQKQDEAARLAAEKAAADKAIADKAAKEKADADKATADKMTKEKAEADKVAKEKADKEKAEADKLAKEKANNDKAAADKLAKEKAETDRQAKEKADADKLASDKAEKEKSKAEKTTSDKAAKEKADAEKLATDKAAKEKTDADKLAKEKANTEKLAAEKTKVDNTAKQKKEADQLAANKKSTEKVKEEKPKESPKTETPIAKESPKKNEEVKKEEKITPKQNNDESNKNATKKKTSKSNYTIRPKL